MTQEQLERECLKAFEGGNKRDAERLLLRMQQPAKVGTTSHTIHKDGYGNIKHDIYYHSSLLHPAADHGWMDVVIDLITRYKCDANCENSREARPLHYASLAGHLEVVRYYINEYLLQNVSDNDIHRHHMSFMNLLVMNK